VSNFPIDFSIDLLDSKKVAELDFHLGVKMYAIFSEFSESYQEKGRNILQENPSDNLLIPSYLKLWKSIYSSIQSGCCQNKSYRLDMEKYKKMSQDENISQKALDYFDRYTSHIEVINTDQEIEK
jgi:hypothetical protein